MNSGFRSKAVAGFDAQAPGLAAALQSQLTASSSQVLYDTQLVLAPIIEMAVNCGDRVLLGRIADLLLPAEAKLVRAVDPTSGTVQREWQANGQERRLDAAQFLNAVARVLSGIAAVPASERAPNLQQFAAVYPVAVAEHLKFWLFEAPYYNTTGCVPDVVSSGHGEYLRNMKNRSLGTGRSFCSSPADRDMLVTADAAELLRASSIDPVMVNLEALGLDATALVSYLNGAGGAYRSFFVPTSYIDENAVTRTGLDFDTGGWRDWTEDFAYSAFTESRFPAPADAGTDPRASWDLSHARRLVSLFGSMRAVSARLSAPFPSDDEMRAFANQLAYGVATGTVRPLFRNFLSGVNGWFRVNYSGRPGFGYGPFDSGTQAFIEGGFGLWGQWSERLKSVTKAVDDVLNATDPATVAFRTANYGVIWYGGVRTRVFDASRAAMTFSATAIVPNPPPAPSTTTATTKRGATATATGGPVATVVGATVVATRSKLTSAVLTSAVRWSSSHATKNPSAPARNARLPGTFAIFLSPEPPNTALVQWYLDGVATHIDDATAPFDLRNGLVEAPCGRHVVTVHLTDTSGALTAVKVPFTVIEPCKGKVPSA